MNRGGRILIVCHCILNANAKIRPLAGYPGALAALLAPFLAEGVGLVQLPCPETVVLGMTRWGMSREQYDTPFLRRAFRRLLAPQVDSLAAFARDGCELLAVVGMDGSPSCGVFATCAGYEGGELSGPPEDLARRLSHLAMVPGRGVYFSELAAMLVDRGLAVPFWSVDEADPTGLRTADPHLKPSGV